MFELTVEDEFCAAHAITVAGRPEATHGHNWRVTVVVEGEALDADGLLCDFHELERRLADVLRPFRDADLNRTPPFDRRNPTAEHVAQHIGESVARGLPEGVRVRAATVTEAPGCRATWRAAEDSPRRAAEGRGERAG